MSHLDQPFQNQSALQNVDVVVASVYEAAGYKIATISAQDSDKDENAQITFMLEEITDDTNIISSLFMIDENDGSIKISRVMSRDHIGEYKIKIIAQDKGKPVLRTEKVIRIKIKDIPPQTSFAQNANVQVTGNVLIVIILSTISAFLTALLIGAILCMIRPCCQSDTLASDYQQDSQNANTQTLLQKLPPNYYNANPYGNSELYDRSWRQTMSCEQGGCLRYSGHNNVNCLSTNPEEQCSDSGRGASDDDMKALNVNGSVASSSRALASVYGSYAMGETSSRSPWKDTFLTLNPNERNEIISEQRVMFDQRQNHFVPQITFGQMTHIPLMSFHSSCVTPPLQNSSNFRSESFDSLSNSLKQSQNNLSSNNIPTVTNHANASR